MIHISFTFITLLFNSRAVELIRTTWKDIVKEDEWRILMSLVSNLEVEAKERDREQRRLKKEREKEREREQRERDALAASQAVFVQYTPTDGAAPMSAAHPRPLPPNWTEHYHAPSNLPYYVNSLTQETSWEDPRNRGY